MLVSGAGGMVGSALVRRVRDDGLGSVVRLVNAKPTGTPTTTRTNEGAAAHVQWNPLTMSMDAKALPSDGSIDTVVHLGGAALSPFWTAKNKRDVRDSRVNGLRLILDWIKSLPHDKRPRVLVCASGVYGPTPASYAGPAFHEHSEPYNPDTFLGSVSKLTEGTASELKDAGVRAVYVRPGVVLSPHGGALRQMLLPFKLGLGGPMGSGEQKFPWISLRDTVGAILHVIQTPSIEGPVNLVSPTAAETSQRAFAAALGKALHRPAIIPTPAFVLRTVLGQAADEILLGSLKIEPRVLSQTGYVFQDTDLAKCLREMLS